MIFDIGKEEKKYMTVKVAQPVYNSIDFLNT